MSDWDWTERAACKGLPITLFFGREGESRAERAAREPRAAAVCFRCPVRESCLNYAVSRPEKHGTWGALTEDERVNERRRRTRRAA